MKVSAHLFNKSYQIAERMQIEAHMKAMPPSLSFEYQNKALEIKAKVVGGVLDVFA